MSTTLHPNPYGTPVPPPAPKKKVPTWVKVVVGGTLGLVLFAGCVGAVSSEDDPKPAAVATATGSTARATSATSTSAPAAPAPAPEANVPPQGKAALAKAKTYATVMHMSKRGVYDQLVSEFEQFPEGAAQYAVDNVQADWKANALAKAKTYRDTMNMSTSAIRDQLVSEFEQFTPAEADYAVSQLGGR